MVCEKIESVRRRMARAAESAGRDPSGVRLIAVTKTVAVGAIREAVACGITEIGENRVQEAQAKKPEIGSAVCWHLIGHLQKNKAKFAVELFDQIHSLDSVELLEILERTAQKPLDILIQVNVSGEVTKQGVAPNQVALLADRLVQCKKLRWTGLMTMAPYSADPETARPVFRALRELRDSLQQQYRRPLGLSMGMSGDFEVAIQEGAGWVRVGSAIFGERE
jgi:pyridoxal phosphate enzyme (YggS family)